VCAPAGTVLSRVQFRIESNVSAGALSVSMAWALKDGSDSGTHEFDVADPVASAWYTPPWVPDPGRCLRVEASAGLAYSYTLVPETNPTTVLAFYLIARPTIEGYPSE
jgi:hypothetical protein